MGLAVGQVLDGRFEIGTLIGYGGQGVVLNVRHLEWGKNLALKLPLPKFVESSLNWDRYLHEAETWIRLGAHPNIVRCWFVHPVSNLPGLFLDLIGGGSLDDQIKEQKIAPGEWGKILRVMLEVAEGLNHAHAMGVVHRDIKPENLLVTEDGRIVLTDFGLAKPIDNALQTQSGAEGLSAAARAGVTATSGQLVGTPRYGAPEQWRKGVTVGTPADIYSLGQIYFQMLCGRLPFEAPDEEPDVMELLRRQLHVEAPDPREFRPDIPANMAILAKRCLEKDPEYRPQSAQELIYLLSELLTLETDEGEYDRPTMVPSGQRPDLLNNAAVSLHSLGKPDKTRALLKRGLRMEAGHPQCLYNLVQLDRREGRIDAAESLRRLRQAKANYELALVCVEEGLGEQARALLEAIPREEKTGIVHRSEGDAQMYAGQYEAARNAYRIARGEMPFDKPTQLRLSMAEKGTRSNDGHILFPSSESVARGSEAGAMLSLSPDSESLLAITPREIATLPLQGGPAATMPRPEGATPPEQIWQGEKTLLCQDAERVELWDLAERQLTSTIPGRLVAFTPTMNRLVVRRPEGLFTVTRGQEQTIRFAPCDEPKLQPSACFASDGRRVCLLTPDGKIAQLSDNQEAVPLPWPPSVPCEEEVKGFELTSAGAVYLVSGDKLHAFHFATQTEASWGLPLRPERLWVDPLEANSVVSSNDEYAVVDAGGQVRLHGKGPCAVDAERRYLVAWSKGYLTAYNLAPFHRLRTWSEEIAQPRSIIIGHNGRRILTVDGEGSWQAWEFDETNRVFERHLQLSPGASYQQIIDSHQAFEDLFSQAKRLYQKKQYYLAYRTVLNCRAESGFRQDVEALELQWLTCRHLRRTTLESMWERIYFKDVVETALSNDHHRLAVARHDRWSLHDLVDGGRVCLEIDVTSPILCCFECGNNEVGLIHSDGKASLWDSAQGTKKKEEDLGQGPLRLAQRAEGGACLLSADSKLAFFDSGSFRGKWSYPLGDKEVRQVFPLSRDRVVVSFLDGDPELIQLKRGRSGPALSPELSGLEGSLSFASENEGIFLAGFSDGTLALANSSDGSLLFSVKHGETPITAAVLNLEMAYGISGDAGGELTLFDLASGGVIERFNAHAVGFDCIRLTEDGRYLSTRSARGGFRLWEFSWELSEEPAPNEIPWRPKPSLGKRLGLF